MYAWSSKEFPNPFIWTWNWFLSLFGKRVFGKVTFGCTNEECGEEHTINVWSPPNVSPYEAIQTLVQREFERQQG